MRQVMNAANLPRSLQAGAIITLCCLPALVLRLPLALALSQAIVLCIVCVLMWQICLAWTPQVIRDRRGWRERAFRPLLGVAVFMVIVDLLFLDRWLSGLVPDYYPSGWEDFATSLPWVVMFKPLFVIATPFAFAFRLSKKQTVGVATVILFSQCIAVAQAWDLGSLPVAAIALLVGIRAAVLVVAYREAGFTGAALLSGILYVRFLISLLIGGS